MNGRFFAPTVPTQINTANNNQKANMSLEMGPYVMPSLGGTTTTTATKTRGKAGNICIFQTADEYFNSYVNSKMLANFQTNLLNRPHNSEALSLLADYLLLLLDERQNYSLETLVAAKNAFLAELARNTSLASMLALWPTILCHESPTAAAKAVPTFMLSDNLPMCLVSLRPSDKNTNCLLVGTSPNASAANPASQLFQGEEGGGADVVKQHLDQCYALLETMHNTNLSDEDSDVAFQANYLWNTVMSAPLAQLEKFLRARMGSLQAGRVYGTRDDDENRALKDLEARAEGARTEAFVAALYTRVYQRDVAESYRRHDAHWQPFRQLAQTQLASYPHWMSLSFEDVVVLYYQKQYGSRAPPSVSNFYSQLMHVHNTLRTHYRPLNLRQIALQEEALQASCAYLKDTLLVEALRLLRERCWRPLMKTHGEACDVVARRYDEGVARPYRSMTSSVQTLRLCEALDPRPVEGKQTLLVSMNAVLPLVMLRVKNRNVDMPAYLTSPHKKMWLVVEPRSYLDMMRCEPSLATSFASGLYTYSATEEELIKVNVIMNNVTWNLLKPLTHSSAVSEEAVVEMMDMFKNLVSLDMNIFMGADVYVPHFMESVRQSDLPDGRVEHLVPWPSLFPRDMYSPEDHRRYLNFKDSIVGFFFVTSVVRLGGSSDALAAFWHVYRQ